MSAGCTVVETEFMRFFRDRHLQRELDASRTMLRMLEEDLAYHRSVQSGLIVAEYESRIAMMKDEISRLEERLRVQSSGEVTNEFAFGF